MKTNSKTRTTAVLVVWLMPMASCFHANADISWNTVGNLQSCHVCSDNGEWLIVQDIKNGGNNQSSHQTTTVNQFVEIEIENATSSEVQIELQSGPLFFLVPGESILIPFEPLTYQVLPGGQMLAGNELRINITADTGHVYRHKYLLYELEEAIVSSYSLFETAPDNPSDPTNVLLDRLGMESIESNNPFGISGEMLFGLPPTLPGDVNDDGFVNLLDVAPFIELLSSGEFSFAADINQDQHVNLLDVQPFIDALSGN